VHSLSGGETFLVSLALSLALSSISSNRMSIETLFIDEGFGALDSETLKTAMRAIEGLQTRGRKIGVISHLSEMLEQIPVKINVVKKGLGRSRVEISDR
jgi:exonuclease SbcC